MWGIYNKTNLKIGKKFKHNWKYRKIDQNKPKNLEKIKWIKMLKI